MAAFQGGAGDTAELCTRGLGDPPRGDGDPLPAGGAGAEATVSPPAPTSCWPPWDSPVPPASPHPGVAKPAALFQLTYRARFELGVLLDVAPHGVGPAKGVG